MTRKSAIAALLLLPSFSYAATVLSAPPELNNKSYVLVGPVMAEKKLDTLNMIFARSAGRLCRKQVGL
mgnify:CR=1 FL=1